MNSPFPMGLFTNSRSSSHGSTPSIIQPTLIPEAQELMEKLDRKSSNMDDNIKKATNKMNAFFDKLTPLFNYSPYIVLYIILTIAYMLFNSWTSYTTMTTLQKLAESGSSLISSKRYLNE